MTESALTRPDRRAARYNAAAILVIAASFIPPLILLSWIYVGAEHPIYIFDFGAYWYFFQKYGQLISDNPSWWHAALADIWNDDYNPAAVIPLYPFYWAFGGGRTPYIIAISVLYLLPTAVVAAFVATWGDRPFSLRNWTLAFILAVTHLPFWAPTLRGMVDIVGLIFLGLGVITLLRSDFLRRAPLAHAIALGLLLWAPFLFRRWYAFSIVAFFVVAFAIGVAVRWRDGRRDWSTYLQFAAWLSLSGAIVAALSLTFQGGLFLRALTTSYGDLYAAYQVPLVHHLTLIVMRYGYLILAVIAAGVVFSIVRRDGHVLLCCMIAVVAFILFASTQTLGSHHFLPIAFMIFPAYYAGVRGLSSTLVFLPESVRHVPAYVIAASIFVYGITPGIGPLPGPSRLLPDDLARPLTLENFAEYQRLTGDIKKSPTNDKAAVFASSIRLTEDLLRKIEPELTSRLVATPHLAARDLFNFQMITAKLALVPTTPQTHMAPGTQANITMPGELILSGQGIGRAYERLGSEYNLAQGVKAYLYRRTRPVTVDEVNDLIDRLVQAYPSWNGVFDRSAAPILATAEVEPGDVYGVVQPTPPDRLFVHPGETTPTRFTLPFSIGRGAGRLGSMTLSIGRDVLKSCPSADGIAYSIEVDGAPYKTGSTAPGQSVVEPLPPRGDRFSVTIDKGQNPSCDHVLASFSF